jgi:hypothetical protein
MACPIGIENHNLDTMTLGSYERLRSVTLEAQIAMLSDELRHPVRHLLRSVTKGGRP